VYQIHVDFYSYVSLYVRIMQQEVKTRRKLELDQLDEVLSLLVVPRCFYHTRIEDYFEWVEREKTDCVHFCSCCLGEIQHFTKRIDKTGLVSLMSTKLHASNGELFVSDFVKIMKSNKELIFHRDDIPKQQQMSQLYTIALQMIATGMIEFVVTDKTKVGTEAMTKANISIKTTVTSIERDGKTYATPTYMVNEQWEGINTY
jgi:hypothetical protein